MAQEQSNQSYEASGGNTDPQTFKDIRKLVSDATDRIAQREKAGAAATGTDQNKADWDVVMTAVDGLKNGINDLVAGDIIMDTMAKVKNTDPQYRELWDKYQAIAAQYSKDDEHEASVDMYAKALKLSELRPAPAKNGQKDHTHEVPQSMRKEIRNNYLTEIDAERNDFPDMHRSSGALIALNSMSRLLTDPAMKNAKDAGEIWRALDDSVTQVTNNLQDQSQNVPWKRIDLGVLADTLDGLKKTLIKGDNDHRQMIDAMQERVYGAALEVRNELVQAGAVQPDWKGPHDFITRYEVRDVQQAPSQAPTTPSKQTAPLKGPQL